MNPVLTFPAIVFLTAVVLGTVISSICWFYPYRNSSFRLLGASIFSITWTLFIFFLSESRLIYYAAHLFQTSFIGTIVFLPFSYLFVRNHLLRKHLSWQDLIHAVPLAVFIIDYSAIYFLPATEKLQLIATDENRGYVFHQGWFVPADLHRIIRFLLFMIYSALQFNLVLRITSSRSKRVFYYLAAQFLGVSYYFVYQFTLAPFAWRIITVIVSVNLVVLATILIMHPQILYSLGESKATAPKKPLAGRKDQVNGRRIEEICRRLEALMASELPYLRHGYSLSELSSAVRVPSYQLSAILNQHKKVSFHDYLNMHRVAYCKEKILQGAADAVTLEALAFECGFNNRNSFTAAFKQFSGTTPSDFLRMQRNRQPAAKDS